MALGCRGCPLRGALRHVSGYGAVQYAGEGTARCACAGLEWGPSLACAIVGGCSIVLMIRVSPAPRQPES